MAPIPCLSSNRNIRYLGPGLFKWLRPCRRPLEFNSNFGSNLGLFGSGRGFNRRGAPIGLIWAEFQLKPSHGDPFHAQNSRLCATGSNSGAPGAQEISPLTSRTALEQRSVSWGSHLSGFCFEQSHGDLLRDQHVPHIELNVFLLLLYCFLLSFFFLLFLLCSCLLFPYSYLFFLLPSSSSSFSFLLLPYDASLLLFIRTSTLYFLLLRYFGFLFLLP